MYLSPIHLRNQTSNMTLWIKTSGLQGLLQQFYGIYLPQCGGGGKVGGKKGSKLPISHSLNCQCPPHSYWLSSLCTFSITRYYKVIHNFYPVCLGSHHLPIFSSSAFHTPPPSPISYPPRPLLCTRHVCWKTVCIRTMQVELIPVSVAWSDQEYFYFPLYGMLAYSRVTPPIHH